MEQLEQKTRKGKCKVESDPVFTISHGELGKDYDAELVISSRGNYILECRCGHSTIGDLHHINLKEGHINCGNIEDCGFRINGSFVVGQPPRIYRVYIKKQED